MGVALPYPDWTEATAMARAVGMVMIWPIRIMRSAPRTPVWATAYPNRKNRIAPRIVLIPAKKTGAVLKPYPLVVPRGKRKRLLKLNLSNIQFFEE